MHAAQDSTNPSTPLPRPTTLKPSVSFSSTSSAGSGTSAGTPRSGGSRLLFGEIDTSSERSADSYASVCSLVLSESSTFLRFWLTDECRDSLISLLPPSDLASLRLVCHDFSVRAAPALFADLKITFRPYTFTKPSKQAALQRLGFHVKTLTFNLPHTRETSLPPLIEPDTGDELNYTYIPRIQPLAIRQPKYGDWETTEILTRQYPPLFHAATNVDAFIQAFSAFVNLSHLRVSCPGYDTATKCRRTAVDFALISLRIAVERNCLNALDTLTLSPIHPGGLLYLAPQCGLGASPGSLRRWSRIKHLTIHADLHAELLQQQLKTLHTYSNTFKRNLLSLNFRWNDSRGPLPLISIHNRNPRIACHPALSESRPATAPGPSTNATRHKRQQSLHFPLLRRLELDNISTTASDVSAVLALHKRTLEELDVQGSDLTEGTWTEAFMPLTKMAAKSRLPTVEIAEIPIMLSPTTQHFPRTMERIEVTHTVSKGRRSLRASRWLGGMKKSPTLPKTPVLPAMTVGLTTHKVKHGLMDCENKVKQMLKCTVLSWKQ